MTWKGRRLKKDMAHLYSRGAGHLVFKCSDDCEKLPRGAQSLLFLVGQTHDCMLISKNAATHPS